MKRILLLLRIMSLILAAQISNCAPATWYNNAWKYRRTINVDNTANLTDLTSFQVKISLTNANLHFTRPLADGSDLRVTDADGVSLIPLPYSTIRQPDEPHGHHLGFAFPPFPAPKPNPFISITATAPRPPLPCPRPACSIALPPPSGMAWPKTWFMMRRRTSFT